MKNNDIIVECWSISIIQTWYYLLHEHDTTRVHFDSIIVWAKVSCLGNNSNTILRKPCGNVSGANMLHLCIGINQVLQCFDTVGWVI